MNVANKFFQAHVPYKFRKGMSTLLEGWKLITVFMLGVAIQGLPVWIVAYLVYRGFT